MSAKAPELTAKLSLSSAVLFGVAYMSPAIVMLTFGVIASTSAGSTPTAYIFATLAMSLTALSYGKMARIMPASGSAYTYARKMLDSRIGFLVGWSILLDYLFLPMVAWLIQSLYLNAQFPSIPVWAWLTINVLVTTIINVLGIVLADRVNKTLMVLSIAGIFAFVIMCVRHLGATGSSPSVEPFWNPETTIGAVSAAAAIAAYSFLGFDAVSTLSEETHNPKRNIPRAILLTALIGGLIFVSVSYVMQLVHPSGNFEDESTAAYTMSLLVGGQGFADIINTVVIIGGFTSGLAIQASSSRLLYVMGRDGVLPRPFFGRLHHKFKTPVLNLLLIGAVAMFGLNLSLDTATSFINFGAFLTFAMVNICVIAYFIKERRHAIHHPILGFVIIPALGVIIDLYLLTKLSTTAISLGLSWLALGIVYLAIITKGFRKAPPEMQIDPIDKNQHIAPSEVG